MRLALLAAAGLALAGVPAAVTLDGVGEPDPALVEELRPYLEPRSASLADLAPDGRSMLVLTRFGDTTQVHRVDAPLGAREQLSFFSEPVRSARWTPEGDLLFLRDTGGDEQHQIFRLEGGRAHRLTDGVHRHSGPLLSPDGRLVAFTNNARDGRATDVRLARLVDGDFMEERLVTAEPGTWSALDFSPDQRRLLVQRTVSVTETELYVVDLDTLARRRVGEGEVPAAHHDAAFLDEDSLLVTSDWGGEHVGLWRVDLGRTPRKDTLSPLTADIPWDVRGLTLSKDRRRAAFLANVEGSDALYLLDPEAGRREPLDLPPMSVVGGLRFADEAPVLGLTLEGPTRPADAWTLDLDTRALTRWTRSEIGGLDPEGFVMPELVRIPSFDGRAVPAFVMRPPGEGPHPVLISIHGGPEAQARTQFNPGLQAFVARGIAVITPNVRGSRGYGREWLSLDDGFKREDSVRDIGAVLDFIAADPGLDAARVGVRGGSYGGYMVLASLIHYGERIVAGSDAVGISNFVTFLEATSPYRQDLRRVEYGDERDPAMRAHLLAISPTTRADEIRSDLFVAHGANDPRVPLAEAEQIVEAVRASGGEVWFMVAADEGHGFAKKPNRDLHTALQAQFFFSRLLDETSPPPRLLPEAP